MAKYIIIYSKSVYTDGFKLLYNNCEGFRNFINNFLSSIKQFFINTWNGIVTFFTETIPQWIQNVINWFSQLPYMIGYHIGQILGNIVQFGLNVWSWITNDLPQIVQSIIDWFAQLPRRIWEWLCNVVDNIGQWGQNVYNTASLWTSNTINNIINWFSQLPEKIWNYLQNTSMKIGQWIIDMYNKFCYGINNIINGISEWFSQLPSKMVEIGRNIVEGIWNGIVGAKDWLKNKVGEFSQGILDGMKESLRNTFTIYKSKRFSTVNSFLAV